MMTLSSFTTLDCILLLGVVLLTYGLCMRVGRRAHRLPRPPGPRGYPVIGTLPLHEPSWITYRNWSEVYDSDIISLNMLGNTIVILNSLEASIDLLEKRSTIYSDRPGAGITMLKELCGLAWSFGLQPYGQQWRDGRKAFRREFRPGAVGKYQSTHARKVHTLLRALLASPDNFMSHVQHMVGGGIVAIGYGIEVQDENDPWIATAEHAAAAVIATLNPGSYLVDLLPFLKYVPEWFPGADFQRQARIWRKSVMAARNEPYDVVKGQMEKDHSATPDCAAKSLIENVVENAEDSAYMEEIVRSALGSMFLAGADTSTSIIWSFILAMVLYPDVFRKAQKSVDAICHGRLPVFSDRQSLPYVEAVVKECLRWNPVVALNLAHQSTQDDVYRSFYIPKGSIVISNLWAILHDPTVYDVPEDFNPERFLIEHPGSECVTLALNPNVRDPLDVVFGFGRRVCPGRYLAYDMIWLAIASMLSVFDITRARGEDGAPITPDGEYVLGFTCHPKPFPCNITARSPEHVALILGTLEVTGER